MKIVVFLTILGISINTLAQDNFPGPLFVLSSPESFQNKPINNRKYICPLTEISTHERSGLAGTGQQLFLEPPVQLIDSIYTWQWDTLFSGWSYSSRTYDLVYDANNHLTNQLVDFWDQDAWEKNTKWIITYDENNIKNNELIQRWNGSEYENILQRIYTSDTVHTSTIAVYQSWHNNAWENFIRYTSIFDANENVILHLTANWDGSEWLNQNQYVYTYDKHNNLIYQISQFWYNGEWNNYEKFSVTYDANNKISYSLRQLWDIDTWYDANQSTYTYDSINNSLSVLSQYWDGFMWINTHLYFSNYNDSNNVIYSLTKQWNNTNFRNLSEYIYTYDADEFITGQSSKSFDIDGISIIGGDSTHYYFRTISGNNSIKDELVEIEIYPNPSNGKFIIRSSGNLGSLACYNILGKHIYQTNNFAGQNSAEIDLSHFGKGIYFISIEEGRKICTRKIIIQ